ncbi:hypothetical protein COU00_01695 [Candidatus Falkowbacteria bacterium CG10_big_fil_rev_8_21_14_0_10_43_11]|uniref:Uncharacterized protein n=1 Tax=Candidatus Falkowbacteria bacterium CG10_big_fil_rev_8_21_14_0_10_43_11 TaxID=1974568 RepID=A0A2M6WMC6_9BACT|nr:MAG: hypothetical protein COU00_01695 [Candidatus Falkowbacteria bacterium CG10_big_fil_rev_8_21_14_0_10_43_11]
MKTLKQKSNGFTLIEVMVSIAIITIAFFAIVNFFPASLKINEKAQNLTTAAYLAQAGIEQSLSLGYEPLGTGTVETKDRLSADIADFRYRFYRQTTVAYIDNNLADSVSDTGLKKITSVVYWQNPMELIERQYAITTLLSKN